MIIQDRYVFYYKTLFSIPCNCYGDTLYWSGALGEITNRSAHNIVGLKPYLELYFTQQTNAARQADTSAVGALGRDVYYFDEGLRWRTDTLKVDSTLTMFVAIGFKLPAYATGVWYEFGFVYQNQVQRASGGVLHTNVEFVDRPRNMLRMRKRDEMN